MLDPETVAQLAALASRGPRYTSYPPATEFRPIEPGCVQRELERVGDRGESISLYVHIPFCRSLCWYCGCNVIPVRDASRGVAYLDRLALEIDRVGTAVRSAPVTEIRRNLKFSLAYNLIAGALAITGLIHPLIAAAVMPLSSLTVLASSLRSKAFRS
jgi:hypothetical protein